MLWVEVFIGSEGGKEGRVDATQKEKKKGKKKRYITFQHIPS